jgi:hypothetical protein
MKTEEEAKKAGAIGAEGAEKAVYKVKSVTNIQISPFFC